MPNASTVLRPGPVSGYSAGYLGGFDVYASAGPNDGLAVVTLWAQARPSAWLLGPGIAAVLSQLSTYYGGGKGASVLAAAGLGTITTNGAAGAAAGTPYVVINADFVSYNVLPADLVSQATALLALFTNGTNCNKGGNA